MLLLITLLLLAALPEQSLGEEEDAHEEITGSGVSEKLQQIIINKHNKIRRNVNPRASNMLKMVWDEAIGERARNWAKQCKLRMSPKEHRVTNDTFCGEIVFQANYVSTWEEVIDLWDGKKTNFKYGVGATDPALSVYPYTQMIWYNSYRVGCAAEYCHDTKYPYFYVCQYCPAGNFEHEIAKPYKKGKSCGDCPNDCDNKLCTNPCKYKNLSRDCKKLKEILSCKNALLKKSCEATCRCKNSIV